MKRFFNNLLNKIRAMDSLTRVVLLIFIVLSIITSTLAFNFMRSFTTGMTILDLPGAPIINADQSGTTSPQIIIEEAVTAKPWNGTSRVTILLMGLDYRDWQAGETPHSDTMILLTLDPVTKQAGMLSLPRDLWVNITNHKFGRINEAYFIGEANHLPGGGPALATQTVEEFIGVPINFYAQVDFGSFVRFVDEIGGIVIVPFVDTPVERFGVEYKQTLKAGEYYTLPGELALSYARDRYAGQQGDVDRARRTQQVLLAIRQRIIKYNQWPTLIAKAPRLYQELSSGIRTNISFTQAIQLGTLVIQLNISEIKQGVIDFNMVIPSTTDDGSQILIPLMDKIRVLRDDIFSTGGSMAPIAIPNQNSTLVRDEAARVKILNGTGNAGLAARTAEYFRSQGINVVGEGTADQAYSATKIEVYNGKPYTLKWLSEQMGVANTNIWNKFDPNAEADLMVYLGNDWANAMP